jgi:quinol monooxygenase YgiN
MNAILKGLLWAVLMAPLMASPADVGLSNAQYVVAYADVLGSAGPQALRALRVYRDAARREPGAPDVELYAQQGRPSGFATVEVWQDMAAYEAHSKAAAARELDAALHAVLLGPRDIRLNSAYARAVRTPGADPATPPPLTFISHVDVPPPMLGEFQAMLQPYVDASRKEAGNLQMDFLEGAAPRINHFTVIESWINRAAFEAHERSAHTQRYRADLAPKLGALYDEREYRRVD